MIDYSEYQPVLSALSPAGPLAGKKAKYSAKRLSNINSLNKRDVEQQPPSSSGGSA
jgi:hypothetical protein